MLTGPGPRTGWEPHLDHHRGPVPDPGGLPRGAGPRRRARLRHYLMCPPTWFDVTYAINPWMDPTVPVDRGRAQAQWDTLVATHRGLGHRVDVLAPDAALPDMVFTANGALVMDDHALVARFRHTQRRPESDHHLAWLRANLDVTTTMAASTIEAEGDLVVADGVVLAGTGFRTDPAGHAEVAATFGCEVLSLELVDPCYYHLDVALAVLDESTVAWFPDAFAPPTRDGGERGMDRGVNG